MITIFTPTYNRGMLLCNLYKSLISQDTRDFEWLIVDDGSSDNTEQLIKSFLNENRIVIRYYKQKNLGKHRAINRGLKEAKGELFFIVDSDDSLPENSLKIVEYYWNQIKDDSSFAGIVGNIAHNNGEIISKGYNFSVLDCNTIEFRFKYKVKGDMAEVTRTDVLRKYQFPEIPNEKFCPEALVWNRISKFYKFRYFNNVIYYRDYLEGGLTDRIVSIRMNSPISSILYYKELNECEISIIEKIKSAINYWRFWFCLKQKKQAPKLHYLWRYTKFAGFLLHIIDVKNINR